MRSEAADSGDRNPSAAEATGLAVVDDDCDGRDSDGSGLIMGLWLVVLPLLAGPCVTSDGSVEDDCALAATGDSTLPDFATTTALGGLAELK